MSRSHHCRYRRFRYLEHEHPDAYLHQWFHCLGVINHGGHLELQ
jgi:hypothetical protein